MYRYGFICQSHILQNYNTFMEWNVLLLLYMIDNWKQHIDNIFDMKYINDIIYVRCINFMCYW